MPSKPPSLSHYTLYTIFLIIIRLQEKLRRAIDITASNPRILKIRDEIIETEKKYQNDIRLMEKERVDDKTMLSLSQKWNMWVESLLKVEGVVDEVLKLIGEGEEVG